jgi:RNA polymerase sigma factor (sigma-70 family)
MNLKIAENSASSNCDNGNASLSVVGVVTEYAPLVKSRALSFLTLGCELDDLIQEGNIGLLSAAKKYDECFSSFPTFARRCIDAAIIDYLRKSSKLSRIPEAMLVDIADVQVADTALEPLHLVSVKDEYTSMLKKAGSCLSKLEYSVFSDMLSGFSYDEISVRNRINLKSVNNAIRRIRVKLK